MRPFADPEELRLHLGTSEVDVERAAQLLMQASDLIRAYTGRKLTSTTETAFVDGNGRSVLLLPDYPVSDVAVVEVDEEPESDFTWSDSGLLERSSGVWPIGRRNIAVTSTNGFDPIPDDIKHVCLALAGNALAFREQVQQESFGDGVDEAAGFPPHMSLTMAIRRELAGYRRASVA